MTGASSSQKFPLRKGGSAEDYAGVVSRGRKAKGRCGPPLTKGEFFHSFRSSDEGKRQDAKRSLSAESLLAIQPWTSVSEYLREHQTVCSPPHPSFLSRALKEETKPIEFLE